MRRNSHATATKASTITYKDTIQKGKSNFDLLREDSAGATFKRKLSHAHKVQDPVVFFIRNNFKDMGVTA